MKIFLTAAAVAVCLAAPAAEAATVNAGYGSFAEVIGPDNSVLFEFEPSEELTFNFSTSGTGTYDDLVDVAYGIDMKEGFSTFTRYDGLAGATGTLASITTSDPFSVWFEGAGNVAVTLSYMASAVPPAPVPLPAAGLLLIGALGGLGVLRARKRTAA